MGIRTRQNDEFLLWLVRQRAGGATPSDLAARIGKPTQYVTTATVARAYWPVKGRTSP